MGLLNCFIFQKIIKLGDMASLDTNNLFPADKCPPLWASGPDCQGIHKFPFRAEKDAGPKKVSQSPITTGSSVLAMKYEGGVMLAADTLGSYGSLARFTEVDRLIKVNSKTVVGAGGDVADFQFLEQVIKQKQIDEDCKDDGFELKPAALHCWLTRVMYNRRSKFDPLWNVLLVAGMQDEEPFLGFVNLQGTAFTDTVMATGIGTDLCLPVMRKAMEEKGGLLSQAEAKATLEKCIRLCYLRDCRAWPKYTMATIDKEGTKTEGPHMIDSDWEYAKIVSAF